MQCLFEDDFIGILHKYSASGPHLLSTNLLHDKAAGNLGVTECDDHVINLTEASSENAHTLVFNILSFSVNSMCHSKPFTI